MPFVLMNSPKLLQQLEPLRQAIAEILLSSATALTEYELIQRLQQPPYQLISADALRGELKLFRTHFLIFHCLYQLQDLWRSEKSFELAIAPLHIELSDYQADSPALMQLDPLKGYYSNWDNMVETTEAEVAGLLSSFWQGLVTGVVCHDELKQALVTFKLEQPPVSPAELKSQYRRLVHSHHPDKGGELQRMQEVQQAYHVLSSYLANPGR